MCKRAEAQRGQKNGPIETWVSWARGRAGFQAAVFALYFGGGFSLPQKRVVSWTWFIWWVERAADWVVVLKILWNSRKPVGSIYLRARL